MNGKQHRAAITRAGHRVMNSGSDAVDSMP